MFALRLALDRESSAGSASKAGENNRRLHWPGRPMMHRIIFAIAVLTSSQAFALDAKQCQTNYSTTVAGCAQSLNFLSPNVRSGAQQACVVDAMLQKKACLAGGTVSCLDKCEAIYNQSVTTCDATYDPAYPNCDP